MNTEFTALLKSRISEKIIFKEIKFLNAGQDSMVFLINNKICMKVNKQEQTKKYLDNEICFFKEILKKDKPDTQNILKYLPAFLFEGTISDSFRYYCYEYISGKNLKQIDNKLPKTLKENVHKNIKYFINCLQKLQLDHKSFPIKSTLQHIAKGWCMKEEEVEALKEEAKIKEKRLGLVLAHGDLWEENILITRDNNIKIIDFGEVCYSYSWVDTLSLSALIKRAR